ncbi:MAG: hypothetical protein A3J76_03795 [Candidatus Moranbacteria bacterium RBG_13_45_13]|nr:MAG: hypothetical protein A3J76_03795 [Candidatus Moranbacteria bacterium RBG_13_45_13]
MPRIFSFALGNIWRWEKSKNKDRLIKYVRNLDVSGIEITLSSKEELYSTKLSTRNTTWLKSLEYVTIHAPFELVKKSENRRELIKQLDVIARLYKEVNAKNVIIHPDNLPPPDVLQKYKFNVSTENLSISSKYKSLNLEGIFIRYEDIKLCLDISHAYSWSRREIEYLVKKYRPRISQIHFSGTYRKRTHQSLQIVSKDFLKSIRPLRDLHVPIVIEGDVEKKDIMFLKREFRYIKKYFN